MKSGRRRIEVNLDELDQVLDDRTLVLLRHAKSDWSGPEADIDRPLSSRGRRQAPDAGSWLAANIGPIGLAVVSPASRARSTWELVAGELDPHPRTLIDDRLCAASLEEMLAVQTAITAGSDRAWNWPR